MMHSIAARAEIARLPNNNPAQDRKTWVERMEAEGIKLRLGEPLSAHTSYRIGGPADLFATARTSEQLCWLIQRARDTGTPYFILGGGTNILVSDRGFRGLVIENVSRGYEIIDGNRVRVQAGELLRTVARRTIEAGLAGLEWAVDIPGTVGGAVIGNAGAFGGYVGDVLQRVELLSADGTIQWVPAQELGLGYRTSRLKERKLQRAAERGNRQGEGEEIVLAAEFSLHRESVDRLRQRATEYTRRRKERQPNEPSAGSVFKRTTQYPAGFLIEQAGLKGERCGDAQISPKHANFIVNLGHARATDVLRLIELIQERVRQMFKIELELEIELVGEW